jgi:NTP pyrophosphatase (non-canonical NTP hydrolase)
MTKKLISLDAYQEFVGDTTSLASSNPEEFVARVNELERKMPEDNVNAVGVDLNRLLTAAIGLTAEGGEFAEVVKKIAFQGKPYNEQSRIHMIKEMGDVMWYIAQGCIALGTSIEEVLETNVEKLTARYPEGVFRVFHSENRKEGDI